LAASSSSMPFPQHDPPIYKCLFHKIVIGCVREYSRATCALAPISLRPTSFDTTLALTPLHHELNGYFMLFLEDYELDQNLILSSDSFKLTFQCMPHLSANGFSGMVFEHFWDYFHLEDSRSGFS
jgi:hypothetical protein